MRRVWCSGCSAAELLVGAETVPELQQALGLRVEHLDKYTDPRELRGFMV